MDHKHTNYTLSLVVKLVLVSPATGNLDVANTLNVEVTQPEKVGSLDAPNDNAPRFLSDDALHADGLKIATAITNALAVQQDQTFASGYLMFYAQRECVECRQPYGRAMRFTMVLNTTMQKAKPERIRESIPWYLAIHEVREALANTIFMDLKARGPFAAAAIQS